MDPTQPPTQEPVQTPPEVFIPQPKPNYLKTIIFSVLIIITLGLIAYLFFQNQKLRKQVLNPPVSPTIQSSSPTPKTVSSISIPSDQTEGWKTYKNTSDAFSLKYPSSWIYREGSEGPEFAPSDKLFSIPYTEVFSPISVFIKTTDNFDLSNTSFNQYEEKPITISEINTNRITGINKGTNTRITGVKFTHNGKIFIIVTFGNNYIQTFDQILSTFKFVNNTQDSNLPIGWIYYKDSVCNLNLPIPPKKTDSDNRTWQIENHAPYDFFSFFKGNAVSIIHRNPEEASGFVSGMILIACGQSSDSLTKLNSDFHSYLTLQTQQNTIPEALIELTSNNDVNMWGKTAKEMAFTGGMFDPKQKYYLIVKSDKWYIVTKKSDSSNSNINQQTNQIFNLISFN